MGKINRKHTMLDNSSLNYRKMKQEMGTVVLGGHKM